MKFDPAKAWPHPVLRPQRYGDDYPDAEFEVEIEVKRAKGSTAIEVRADFQLSDPDLCSLISQGEAQFVLLVKASKTHFRQLLGSGEMKIEESFPAGALSGRVEFSPFLVCISHITQFKASGWHSDFAELTFDIPVGAVLAEDESKDYWVDTSDEAPLGSIFGHKRDPRLEDGFWKYEIAEDRVWIVMSGGDGARYEAAREQANGRPDGQYLMNGLYLPVLIAVLNHVDQDIDEYRDCRWYPSLDHRLEEVGCKPLGDGGSDRHIDAQKLLDSPFLKMPLMANPES